MHKYFLKKFKKYELIIIMYFKIKYLIIKKCFPAVASAKAGKHVIRQLRNPGRSRVKRQEHFPDNFYNSKSVSKEWPLKKASGSLQLFRMYLMLRMKGEIFP